MKVKKVPLRTCVITKESLPKQELLRIVRTPEMEVKVDETGKTEVEKTPTEGDTSTDQKPEDDKKKHNPLYY